MCLQRYVQKIDFEWLPISFLSRKVLLCLYRASENPVVRSGLNFASFHPMNKSISRNILYLLCIQGGNYLFPLLLFPYLAKVLGVVEFGVLSYCQAIIQYFILLTDFGFNLSATRRVAMYREDDRRLSQVYSSTTVVRMILVVVAFIALLGWLLLFPSKEGRSIVLLASFAAVVGNALFPIWLFQGIEQMRLLMFATLVSRLISFILIVSLVRESSDTAVAALCLATSNIFLAATAFAVIRLKKLTRFEKPTYDAIKESFFDAFPIFRSNVVTSFYLNLSPILLAAFHGAASVGHFSAADKLRMAAQAALLPVVQSFYPSISNSNEASPAHANQLLQKAKGMIIAIALSALMVLGIFAQMIISILFGDQFAEAVPLLRMEALLVPITAVSLLYGQLGLIAAGKARELSKIYMFVGVIHLTYAVPLTMMYAANGTIVSIIITEAIASLAVFWQYKLLVKPRWTSNNNCDSNVRPV